MTQNGKEVDMGLYWTEGGNDTAMGKDTQIKNESKSGNPCPSSACMTQVKWQEHHVETEARKMRYLQEYYALLYGPEVSMDANTLSMTVLGSHTVSDIRSQIGLRPRQSRRLL